REKCVVVKNGASPLKNFGPRSSVSGGKTRILTVGRFEPYKRMDYLVRVLRQLPEKYCGTLVTNGAGTAWCRGAAADLLSSGRLELKTDLNAPTLEKEYASADVLLHPSLYEGFCLPAVEALASGCAVVYQSGSAMDEILAPNVAVAMAKDAPVDHWVQSVEAA